MKEGITPHTVVKFSVLFFILFCIVFFSDNTLASISFLIDQTFGIMQPSTLSSWSHWPRGPVDLKSYWPPGKSTGPHFSPTDVYIRD